MQVHINNWLGIALLYFTVIHPTFAQDHPHGMHNQANKHMHSQKFDTLVARFENEERAKWQQPEKVIALMGNLKKATVVEIGAGTGYFSFRIAPQAKQVIAADVDERFLKYINQKIQKENLSTKIQTRKIPYDSPLLEREEADWVLLVNVYHHIENRVDYFQKTKEGLKSKGKLMIVDFKKGDLPHGPSDEMKLSADAVKQELEKAGFKKIQIDQNTLEYQYILIAE